MTNTNYIPVVKSILDSVYDNYFEAGATKDSALVNKKVAHEVFESDQNFLLKLYVPGYQKNDFDIKIDKNELIVSSNAELDQPEGYKVVQSTVKNGKIYKTFQLSNAVDTEGIKATYENGVLSFLISKLEKTKSVRNITID